MNANSKKKELFIMKEIVYEFADGTKSVIEVDDALADEIIISRREEENYETTFQFRLAGSPACVNAGGKLRCFQMPSIPRSVYLMSLAS